MKLAIAECGYWRTMTISGVGGVTTSYLLDKNRPYGAGAGEYEDGSSVASYAYGLDLLEQERAGRNDLSVDGARGSTGGATG